MENNAKQKTSISKHSRTKNLKNFKDSKKVKFVFTDIDDTLTLDGKLPDNSYKALWDLHKHGFKIIPITGRPAGWCEMIARFWPVDGVIGENGAFYYRYLNGKMKRHYILRESEIKKNRIKLNKISKEILKSVPGTAIASDQFSRVFDLAIDFSEDVKPLSKTKIQKIVSIFEKHKAIAKVSSIHVNGWFGKYDKLSMCKVFLRREFKLHVSNEKSSNTTHSKNNNICAFIGDSPNDEPMFGFFKNSFAVQNIMDFYLDLKDRPQYITPSKGANGFSEFAKYLCS